MFQENSFRFLEELAANNERAWFEANKARYEELVRGPALEFIAAMAPIIQKIAPHFRTDARKTGGSLMRVFRDTRFSRDKTPYKTNIGIQFRHELGRDVHAPGFYVHLANDECFFGAGCWHPEPEALGKIRDRLVDDTAGWLAARDDAAFGAIWQLSGDSLSRPPRGYDPQHAVIDDLKRKDFIAIAPFAAADAISKDFPRLAGERFAAATPLMRFLCRALDVPF